MEDNKVGKVRSTLQRGCYKWLAGKVLIPNKGCPSNEKL
jgi:hypothetical protein